MTDFPPAEPRRLNELQAYDAMVHFLESYWTRCGKSSDDIAILLSNISREMWANAMPGDPASWGDWQDAVSAVLEPAER